MERLIALFRSVEERCASVVMDLADGTQEKKMLTDLLEYLKRWFDKHIQGSDKKYAECFNKHGLV